MTQSGPVLPRVSKPIWVGLILATTVSFGALAWAAGPERRALGLTTAPFGWNRLIVIHSLSTLMLSWCLARMLGQWIPALKKPSMAPCWAVAGLAVGYFTLVSGTVVEHVVESNQAGYTSRMFIRTLWCVFLQTPWCLMGLAATKDSEAGSPLFSPTNLLGLALVTAIGIPVSFLAVFIDQQTHIARDDWKQMRLAKARLLVQRLCDVGSTNSLGERSVSVAPSAMPMEVTPTMALSDLQEAGGFVEQQIERILSVEAPDADRLKLAQYYIALNRLADAEATLRPLAARHPSAALALAQLLREQGQKDESRKWANETLTQAQQVTPVNPEEVQARDAILMGAYDVLILLAGEEADFQTAERYLLEALQRLPTRRAFLHSRLGKHYEFIGELAEALEHQRKAAQVDPEHYPPPESLLTKVFSTGAPVGLARPKSSRYK